MPEHRDQNPASEGPNRGPSPHARGDRHAVIALQLR